MRGGAWVYHTGKTGNFESTPVVVDGVLYFPTNAGAPNPGGPIATAGGPARFRNIDASRGEDADTLIAFALP